MTFERQKRRTRKKEKKKKAHIEGCTKQSQGCSQETETSPPHMVTWHRDAHPPRRRAPEMGCRFGSLCGLSSGRGNSTSRCPHLKKLKKNQIKSISPTASRRRMASVSNSLLKSTRHLRGQGLTPIEDRDTTVERGVSGRARPSMSFRSPSPLSWTRVPQAASRTRSVQTHHTCSWYRGAESVLQPQISGANFFFFQKNKNKKQKQKNNNNNRRWHATRNGSPSPKVSSHLTGLGCSTAATTNVVIPRPYLQ